MRFAGTMGLQLCRRKMTWDLVGSRVDLHGYLNVSPSRTGPYSMLRRTQFVADLPYWMYPENTYRVIFIQVRRAERERSISLLTRELAGRAKHLGS